MVQLRSHEVRIQRAENRAESAPGAEQGRVRRSQCQGASVIQQFGQDKLRATVTEQLGDTTRKAHRPMDKQFAQGWAARVIEDHWTAEEVEDHLITEGAANNEQVQIAVKLISEHKLLKEVHSAIDHQCGELNAGTKILKHTILQIRE